MSYCRRCGEHMQLVAPSYGCGGMGTENGCRKCDVVYRQTSGGIVDSGHSFEVVHGVTVDERIYQMALQKKPHQIDWEKSEHYGKWTWSETVYGDSHDHDTEEEALKAIKAFQKRLHDALPWPICPRCWNKSAKMHDVFHCPPCEGQYIKNRGSDEGPKWFYHQEDKCLPAL